MEFCDIVDDSARITALPKWSAVLGYTSVRVGVLKRIDEQVSSGLRACNIVCFARCSRVLNELHEYEEFRVLWLHAIVVKHDRMSNNNATP